MSFLNELATAGSLLDVLNVAAAWVRKMVDADRASVALLNPDATTVEVFVLDGSGAIPASSTVGLADSHIGRSVLGRRQDYAADLRRAEGSDVQRLLAGGLRSSVATPLISSGECYGSLNVASGEVDGFPPEHLNTLIGTAGLIASYLRVHRRVEREKELAQTDELTGLPSRRAIIAELRRRLDTPAATGPLSVLFIDLDEFKVINDAYGHAAGDVVLREISHRFERVLRDGDVVGRLGGDEFLVVLSAPSREADALRVADRLVEASRRPIKIGSLTLVARPSIGVASTPDRSATAESLLTEADMAMYRAKRLHVGVTLADEDVRRHVDVVSAVDRDIEAALNDDKLTFHYQGVYRFEDREMLGCEALVRWDHPTQGPIPPPLLLQRIEANGLTSTFTRWSLDRIATDLSSLRAKYPSWSDRAIAINLNASQLNLADYVEVHLGTLLRFGLRPADIVVELVEHQAVEPGSRAEDALRRLGSYGVIVGLDDFGVGHNVLGYFGRFPIRSIKFDRSLIQAIVDNDTARTVVAGLVRMAADLGIEVLAEGIERRSEMEMARRVGIARGQGYLLGRPAPLAELERSWAHDGLQPSPSGI